MTLPLARNIYFTGFMASGKSRIGSLTAASLGWKFFDTDRLIEERTGRSIPAIFAEDGEEAFRRMEVEALREISGQGPMVASLGGGTLKNPEAIDIVRSGGLLVGLRASPEVILERVNRKKDSRPLLAGLDDEAKLAKIKAMLADRAPLYALADFQFESDEKVPHHVLTRRIIHRLQVEELKPLRVELGDRSYPIYVEENLAGHVDSIAEKAGCPARFLIVTDGNIKAGQRRLLDQMRSALGHPDVFYFKAGEEEKHLKSINKLLTFMLRHGYTRKTTVVALGGGVVGDMAGFAASIFMRGVPFIQAPTTLLSMVDSSVGGKTGVNHPLGKNMIGSFYQPKAVAISLEALSTLPDREFLAGLAEVVKYAVIRDADFFDYLDRRAEDLLARKGDVLKETVLRCCALKAEVVGQDERETAEGVRAILNYGHTFGHAYEVLGGYGTLPHGLAVALGMRSAARLAVLLGRLSAEDEARQDALLDKLGMPKVFPKPLDEEKAWEAMGLDKKVDAGKRVYILPDRIGKVDPVKEVDKTLVLQAIAKVRDPSAGSGSRREASAPARTADGARRGDGRRPARVDAAQAGGSEAPQPTREGGIREAQASTAAPAAPPEDEGP
jgi:3-dehydroquinate synthase/shikimate kinase/3-dehydroquinate synthase